MFCSNCGKELPENETVCPNCGTDNAKHDEPVQQAAPQQAPAQPVQPAQQIIVQQAAPARTNGSATTGFVLSLLSWFLPGISFILGVIGIIMSIVGIVNASKMNGAGRGMAIAGLILGVLGLVFWIVLLAVYIIPMIQYSIAGLAAYY